MQTVLAISDSVENTQFDLGRCIATIKAHNFDPLAVIPTFYRADGSSDSYDVNEIIDYVFGECDNAFVRIGYLTRPEVLSYLCSKISGFSKKNIVVEPSLIADNGAILVNEDIYSIVCDDLIKHSNLLVINSFEAELLAEFECPDRKDYMRAAKKIFDEFGCSVLIKSSSRTEDFSIVFDGSDYACFENPTVKSGFDVEQYDLVTAITCALVTDMSVIEAVEYALEFNTGNKKAIGSVDEVVLESNDYVEPLVEETAPETIIEPEVKIPAKVEFKERNIDFSKKTSVPSFKMPSFAMNNEENRSLVSPAKSLREIGRSFDYPALKTQNEEAQNTAVTSTIEKPAPGPLGAVSDISTPEARLKYNVSELESLRDRLKNIAGSSNS